MRKLWQAMRENAACALKQDKRRETGDRTIPNATENLRARKNKQKVSIERARGIVAREERPTYRTSSWRTLPARRRRHGPDEPITLNPLLHADADAPAARASAGAGASAQAQARRRGPRPRPPTVPLQVARRRSGRASPIAATAAATANLARGIEVIGVHRAAP